MFRKVLVPLDRSALAEQAIGQAAAIARASAAEIDLVLVHEPFAFNGYADSIWTDTEQSAEHAYLEAIAAELREGARVPVTHGLLRGAPAEMIARRAADVDADVIVMTTHGRTGVSRAWLGSVADEVMRHSAIPVLMLRPVETSFDRLAVRHTFRHILVPLDGSDLADEVLDSAISLAKASGASLTLLDVVQPVPLIAPYDVGLPFVYPPTVQDLAATSELEVRSFARLTKLAAELRAKHALTVSADIVVDPHVARSIVDYARGHEVDVIAMSTHGRGTSRMILGSVADKVLRLGTLPVLLQRPAKLGAEPEAVSSQRTADLFPVYAI